MSRVTALDPDGAAHVTLEQDSGAQGALLAIDNATGEIKAMVGGRDFNESKFNRATQALRQVGSSFKPYVYTAVIDQGGSPDDTILDAPITFETASGPYTPHNYDEKFEGVITSASSPRPVPQHSRPASSPSDSASRLSSTMLIASASRRTSRRISRSHSAPPKSL